MIEGKFRDDQLVRGCLVGDRRMWEVLVRRYTRHVTSIALKFGLSRDDAADVFQTVCLRLLQNLEKLKNDEHLTGWLTITARNECYHILRRRRREATESLSGEGAPSALEIADQDEPLPEEVILRLEEAQMVRVALEQLGERCRTLLSLLYHRDPPFSYVQVAKQLDVPVGAVGPTRLRCLAQLKQGLLRGGF
jgi:RNA polymerase sigma factor (sigma-70 family)